MKTTVSATAISQVLHFLKEKNVHNFHRLIKIYLSKNSSNLNNQCLRNSNRKPYFRFSIPIMLVSYFILLMTRQWKWNYSHHVDWEHRFFAVFICNTINLQVCLHIIPIFSMENPIRNSYKSIDFSMFDNQPINIFHSMISDRHNEWKTLQAHSLTAAYSISILYLCVNMICCSLLFVVQLVEKTHSHSKSVAIHSINVFVHSLY